MGELSVEEVPTITPKLVEGIDSTTTLPSTIMYDEQGKPIVATNTSANILETQKGESAIRDEALNKAQERANKQGFATYVDPVTGEKKQLTEGGIEPAYDILFGPAGKLGAFGVLTMPVGAEVGRVAATQTGVALSDAANALVARGGIFKDLVETKGGLSQEAKYLLANHPDITEEQLAPILTNVKTADQAMAINRWLGETGHVNVAVGEGGSKAAGYLRAQLNQARDKFINTVGHSDMEQAKAQYGDMTAGIGEGYTGRYDASSIKEDINNIYQIHHITEGRVGRIARSLKAAIGEENRLSLPDALDLRPDINFLINKADNGGEVKKLEAIKDSLDSFINSVATPEQQQVITSAIDNYSNTAQNKTILDIISKNTNEQGFAVNWAMAHRDMEKAGLRKPEAVRSMRIAEVYAKKYGNDKLLASAAMDTGTNPSAGGVMGVMGYLVNGLRNIAAKGELGLGIATERGKDLRIQESILKTIMRDLEKSKSDLDFVDKMMANKDIPEEVKPDLKTMFESSKALVPIKGEESRFIPPEAPPPRGPSGGEPIPKPVEDVPANKVDT